MYCCSLDCLGVRQKLTPQQDFRVVLPQVILSSSCGPCPFLCPARNAGEKRRLALWLGGRALSSIFAVHTVAWGPPRRLRVTTGILQFVGSQFNLLFLQSTHQSRSFGLKISSHLSCETRICFFHRAGLHHERTTIFHHQGFLPCLQIVKVRSCERP